MDSIRCSRLAFTLFSCPEYVLITYQRNIRSSLAQHDVLDEVLPQLIVQPEVGADDDAGDQHDRRPAHDRLLVRPLDLLELGDRLLDEMDRARARDVPLLAARPARLRVAARGGPRRGTGRGWPAREGRLLLRAPRATLLTRLPRHTRGLAGLPMRGVPAAPAAVLLELDPVGGVPLGLLRLIVTPLAHGAGERDCDSNSGGHFLVSTSR